MCLGAFRSPYRHGKSALVAVTGRIPRSAGHRIGSDGKPAARWRNASDGYRPRIVRGGGREKHPGAGFVVKFHGDVCRANQVGWGGVRDRHGARGHAGAAQVIGDRVRQRICAGHIDIHRSAALEMCRQIKQGRRTGVLAKSIAAPSNHGPVRFQYHATRESG